MRNVDYLHALHINAQPWSQDPPRKFSVDSISTPPTARTSFTRRCRVIRGGAWAASDAIGQPVRPPARRIGCRGLCTWRPRGVRGEASRDATVPGRAEPSEVSGARPFVRNTRRWLRAWRSGTTRISSFSRVRNAGQKRSRRERLNARASLVKMWSNNFPAFFFSRHPVFLFLLLSQPEAKSRSAGEFRASRGLAADGEHDTYVRNRR